MNLSPRRALLYGLALFLTGLALFPAMLRNVAGFGTRSDWGEFWTAGSTVGSHALLHPVASGPFVYVPGAAWLLAPAAHLSLGASFLANAIVMLLLCVASAGIAAVTYDLDVRITIAAIFAWTPTTVAILTGQNAPLGLLLALTAVFGFARDRAVLAGSAIGLLLYKPTYALPYIVLLLACRKWRALAVVGAWAVVWYLLSVAATAGDWAWPVSYLHVLHAYAAPDFARNADKAVSLPGILMRVRVPALVAGFTGVALLVASSFVMPRINRLEAASVAGLAGLAASVHAWEYDAILVVPATLYFARYVPRCRWPILWGYVIAVLCPYASWLHVDTLAAVVLAGTGAWFARHRRRRVRPAAG